MDKAYNVECVKSIYDAQKTQGLIDQIQKASIESLTSAVKDSYRTLVTSKDFQKIVREEVQRALAEQNGER